MKILIVSALFPPDVADPAPYIKQLAGRLKTAGHDVSILIYGSLPETVDGVPITTVPKRLAAPLRILKFTHKLLQLGRQQDVILVHNAPSTGLPLIIISPLLKQKLYLMISDTKINYTGWRRILHSLERKQVRQVISIPLPLPRPEILPLASYPQAEFARYQQTWSEHTKELVHVFTHVTD